MFLKVSNMEAGVPIRPQDVASLKAVVIPSFVIDAFNKEITAQYSYGTARILLKNIKPKIIQQCQAHNVPFDDAFMDVEPVFENVGWTVKYEKPGYSEFFDSYYIFTQKQ